MQRRTIWLLATLLAARASAGAQAAARPDPAVPPQERPASPVEKRAEAYSRFAMGHYYAELYELTSRSEYAALAIENYKKAYDLDPEAGVIREQLAEMYARSQRIRDAVLEAQELLKRDPDNLAARRLLARIYLRTLGDLDPSVAQRETVGRAIEQYREILRLAPDDAEAAQWLARLYRLQNEPAKAEEVLRATLGRDPDNEALLQPLAQLLLDQSRADEAIALLQGSVDRAPTPGLLDLLGNAYTQTLQHEKAAGAYRRAIESEPANPDHRRGLAEALASGRKFEAALEQYQRLLEMDPEGWEAYLRMAQIYRRLNKLEQAEEYVVRARQHAPGSLEVIYQEAMVYEAQGRFEDAIRVLSGAITGMKAQARRGGDTRRTLGALYEQLGRLYREVEDYDAARQTFRELGVLGPEEEKRSRELIIDSYRASRDLERALEESEKTRKVYPNDRGVETTHALLLGEKGDTDAAADILRGMLSSLGEDRGLYLGLTQVYERGRRYAEAERAAESAARLASRPEENEAVWFLLGAIQERQKRYDLAEDYFKKALAINPHNAAALNYYGYMLADRGIRLEEAADLVRRALEEEQNNGAYLDSLGWVYFRLGRLEEAETYLRQAVTRSGHDPTIRDHLGDVLFKRGRIEQAAAEWERALQEWRRVLPTEYEADKVLELEKKLGQLKRRLAQTGGREAKPE